MAYDENKQEEMALWLEFTGGPGRRLLFTIKSLNKQCLFFAIKLLIKFSDMKTLEGVAKALLKDTRSIFIALIIF